MCGNADGWGRGGTRQSLGLPTPGLGGHAKPLVK